MFGITNGTTSGYSRKGWEPSRAPSKKKKIGRGTNYFPLNQQRNSSHCRIILQSPINTVTFPVVIMTKFSNWGFQLLGETIGYRTTRCRIWELIDCCLDCYLLCEANCSRLLN